MKKLHVRIIALALVALIGLVSATKVATYTSNPENHKETMQVLDEKKENVLKLTALSAASSTAISLLPGDAGTPIAEKIADFSAYFLFILSALFLEKYMLTIAGFAAFKILIPIAMLLLGIWVFTQKEFMWKSAIKITLFAILLYATIPTTVLVTNMIEDSYNVSLNNTIESAESMNKEINEATGGVEAAEEVEETENNTSSDKADEAGKFSFFKNVKDKINNSVSEITTMGQEKVDEYVKQAEQTLNNFVEVTAIMLVTSCVLPILILVFYLWLAKIFIGIPITTKATNLIS